MWRMPPKVYMWPRLHDDRCRSRLDLLVLCPQVQRRVAAQSDQERVHKYAIGYLELHVAQLQQRLQQQQQQPLQQGTGAHALQQPRSASVQQGDQVLTGLQLDDRLGSTASGPPSATSSEYGTASAHTEHEALEASWTIGTFASDGSDCDNELDAICSGRSLCQRETVRSSHKYSTGCAHGGAGDSAAADGARAAAKQVPPAGCGWESAGSGYESDVDSDVHTSLCLDGAAERLLAQQGSRGIGS
jgi:hypothetical protein